MPSLFTMVVGYLLVTTMLLSGFAPLLPDTTPGSYRSIVVATAGVLQAVVVLLMLLQMRMVVQSHNEIVNALQESEAEEPPLKKGAQRAVV